MLVIVEDAGARLVFAQPRRVIAAQTTRDVPAALAALNAARAEGQWLAGFFAYELGYALEPRLAPQLPKMGCPLLSFGVYDAPLSALPAHDEMMPAARAYTGVSRLSWSEQQYAAAFAVVKQALIAGDIYQANLSMRAQFAFMGDPLALYEKLRVETEARHCAYVDDGARQIISLSPELFFEIEGTRILARPMKGTAPRAGNVAAERAALAASAKDRAENLMIVDLIRNDLGRLAEIGSVTVPDLFTVETYPTLHTMVSTVIARLRPGASIGEVVAALFPCGSITGAPKIRAMEILRGVEPGPREAYCGALGYFAPGESGRSAFNVAIRTLTIENGHGSMGVGGGIVQDSDCADEYAECLTKARFLTHKRRPLMLIETLRYQGSFVRLARHLQRMAVSAAQLGLPFDEALAQAALARAVEDAECQQPSSALRVRLTLDEAGHFATRTAPLGDSPASWAYALAPQRVRSSDPLLRHKTDWREGLQEHLLAPPLDELVLMNERGELTEGARSSVFLRRGEKWITPPLACGLLPGCLRAEMLESGACEEGVLTEADLRGPLYFGNSLRGLIPGRYHPLGLKA